VGATAPAHAEIGLAPGKRGTAYITFSGAVQHRWSGISGSAMTAHDPKLSYHLPPLDGSNVGSAGIGYVGDNERENTTVRLG
jgi:hypothetical protein